ncbi:MAG: RNA-binding domain-containing protein [Methanobacteriota archaeon]
MKLFVRAEVYLTENLDKVKAAIRNLFEAAIREEEGESVKYLVAMGEGRESLKRFYTLLRSQSILDSARSVLLGKIEGSKTSFSLNKQAAYAGVISFSESTLLGSIEVEIYDEEIEKLVDWLSPKTIGGKEIE